MEKNNKDKKNLDENIDLQNNKQEEDKNIKEQENDNLDSEKKNETTSIEDKLKEFENEISTLKEEKLRLLAEMENLRKRGEKEKIDSIKYGSINLARDILSPNDNLSRALENLSDDSKKIDSIKNIIDGIKMVQKEFESIIEKHGITKIDAINKKFDHNYHQAMFEVETDESEEGVVVQEIQAGYTMHDRLLRPSMVGVSKKKNKEKA